jgi:hypothetical protein
LDELAKRLPALLQASAFRNGTNEGEIVASEVALVRRLRPHAAKVTILFNWTKYRITTHETLTIFLSFCDNCWTTSRCAATWPDKGLPEEVSSLMLAIDKEAAKLK